MNLYVKIRITYPAVRRNACRLLCRYANRKPFVSAYSSDLPDIHLQNPHGAQSELSFEKICKIPHTAAPERVICEIKFLREFRFSCFELSPAVAVADLLS
ncbi:hypothetical protein CEXT_621471 [Caerostris extrusa]|uniref:Uncharacterized protein n=1 Tax=Caerostris extrusa TaxID=172846 RepID=A0AAV4NQW9_CAEEX|nr:hypothetical protein CEXT_621471 [Caerostris extrusa]